MRRLILLIAPILVGLVVFFSFSFYLSRTEVGKGALQVTSVPVSNVYLNGKLLGKTPFCRCEGKDMLEAGNYVVKLVPLAGDNLLPYEEHITINKGVLTVVDRSFGVGEYASGSVVTLAPLTNSRNAQLQVNSFPSGISVMLDGNSVGTTPFVSKSLTESDHELVLSKQGYKEKTVHIHTIAGYQLNALITIGLIATNATDAANFQNASLTPVVKTKITILDTPTGFLRVRADPSLGASETAQVKPGDVFDYVGEQDGWFEIQLSDGKSGWISTQYAQKK